MASLEFSKEKDLQSNKDIRSITDPLLKQLAIQTDADQFETIKKIASYIEFQPAILKAGYVKEISKLTKIPAKDLKSEMFPRSVEKIKPDIKEKKSMVSEGDFIFDDDLVWKPIIFPFAEIGGQKCFGYFLTKQFEAESNFGGFTTNQKKIPVFVSSKRELIQIDQSFSKKYSSVLIELPDGLNYPCRWSLGGINKFLTDESYAPKLETIFSQIVELYKKYLYFAELEWYSVHALWDIGTYFLSCFRYYPILELWGIRGTAKTKIMSLSRQFSFNSTDELSNPSEASLFRDTHSKRCSKYLDEAENLMSFVGGKWTGDERISLLNASYKCSGCVSRVEKIGNRFVVRYYHVFSPTMIASISGLYGATKDRSLVHICTRAPKSDSRGNIEPDETDTVFEKIRDELYSVALLDSSEIQSAYNMFSAKTELFNRELELWKPLLVIAKKINTDLYERMLRFAEGQSELKKMDEIDESSIDYLLLKSLYFILQTGHSQASIKEIVLSIEDRLRPTNKSAGIKLDKLGFRKFKKHTNSGNVFELTVAEFESLVAPFCPNLINEFSSQSSQSSHSRIKEEFVGEDQSKNSEGSEGSEANEQSDGSVNEPTLSTDKDVLNYIMLNPVGNSVYLDIMCSGITNKLKSEGKIAEYRSGSYGVVKEGKND